MAAGVEADGSPRASDRPRAVLLGASNLVRSLPIVVSTVLAAHRSPLDILMAMGHGRGYAHNSFVLGRTLPPIESCGLWDALQLPAGGRTVGLVTDVGNDLLYGADQESIARSVRNCLLRLAPRCDKLTIVQLPLDSLSALGPARFYAFRTLFFPTSRLGHAAARVAARDLDERLAALAGEFSARLVRPSRDWFGMDPIHLLPAHKRQAWQTMLSPWSDTPLSCARRSWWLTWSLMRMRPHQRWLFGREQRWTQPHRVLRDGTTISFY